MYVIGKGTTILQVVPLLLKIKIAKLVAHCYNIDRETKEPGGLPSYFGGVNLQTQERRALPMYITYSDLIQTGIFICALVSLCYKIFKDKRK